MLPGRKGRILGRLLLKFLPWWLFGLVALGMMPVTVDAGRDYLDSRARLATALQSPPPDAVAIAAFEAATDVAALDEVRLRGIWLSDLGIGRIAKQRVDDGYVVIKDVTDTAYAVLYFTGDKGASVEEGLRALIAADGSVIVAGFRRTSSATTTSVTDDLIARGLAAGPPVVVLEPFFGDRRVALAGHVNDALLGFGIVAGINLIFAIIAIVKFRTWRRRVAARAPSPATVPRLNARAAAQTRAASAKPAPVKPGAVTAAPVTSAIARRDGFANGPIQSPKGWFR